MLLLDGVKFSFVVESFFVANEEVDEDVVAFRVDDIDDEEGTREEIDDAESLFALLLNVDEAEDVETDCTDDLLEFDLSENNKSCTISSN